ncbi:MAG: alpha/beta fold hydrolase [Bacteriovoracaceae bacterium]|nr:alpha/beta fold hydrolase [Bacteriovoracaceae bacterium]
MGNEKLLKLRDSKELKTRVTTSAGENRPWIIITHGVGEHLSRHDYFLELFGKDYNIFQYDLRGHGQSSGSRGFIKKFRMYMEDLNEVVDYVRQTYKPEKYCLFGHSMGALIVAGYMQKYVQDDFYPSCLFMSAPPVGVPGVLGTLLKVTPVKMLSQFSWSVKVKGLVDINYLSHDGNVVEEYKQDELNILNLHTKLLLKLIVAARKVFSKPIKPACPAYVVAGTADGIVSFKAIKRYFSIVEKKFHLEAYVGAFHEIHNEIDEYRKPYFNFLSSTIQKELN